MANRKSMKNSTRAGRFLMFPYAVQQSRNYKKLSAQAVKLLVDIGIQYNGRNNGDLCATLSFLKKYGWKSSSTLAEKLDELLYYGFIEKTRQGGKHRCSLYAISWKPINECDGKLDVRETRVASNKWKIDYDTWVPKRKRKNSSSASQIGPIISNCIGDRSNSDDYNGELYRRSNQSNEIH